MIEICLTDLLDKRYNDERTIKLIPGFDIAWSGSGEGRIVMLILSWLNLELSVIAFDIDYYCDVLEDAIKKVEEEKRKEDSSDD